MVLLSFILSVLIGACSKNPSKIISSTPVSETGIDPSIIASEPIRLNYADADSSQKLKFKYLGSGGYFLSNGEASFLIDPFFSPYRMIPLNFKKIATKPDNVELGLKDVSSELRETCEAIFVTHSHYDHLLDVPYVYNRYLDSSRAKVYGSESTKTILSNVIDPKRLVPVSDKVTTQDDMGEWIYLADSSIRVMPLKTEHAPHHKGIFTILLYNGEAQTTEKYESYNSELASMRVNKWKKGDVYAYLIDFLNEDRINFRTYLLSSASSPPDGFVAPEVLRQHKVNLALLGAASFANVENYPEGIINHVQPERILMLHWEDLFKPYMDESPRFIRANNFKELLPRLNEVYPWKVDGDQKIYFPYPGVEIEIHY